MKSIFMRFSLMVWACLCLLMAHSAVTDSLRTENRDGQLFIIHQIDAGETLYGISRRYGVEVKKIVDANGIENNNLQLGQVISIPLKKPSQTEVKPIKGLDKVHVVKAGETLYALGRQYKVAVEKIKKWNRLQGESLDIGQEITIGKSAQKENKAANIEEVPFKGAMKHFVQMGETLERISSKRNVSQDSLMSWNNLRSDNLKIGQILWYRPYDRIGEISVSTKELYGKKVQEGVARQIDNMEDSDKYLALHKTLPPGTLLEVRNLMNNKKVFVRVVGQLPETGLNENVVVRLTKKSFKRLGILDSRARVELSYYDE